MSIQSKSEPDGKGRGLECESFGKVDFEEN